jgi:mRNA-degrading endonuclease RelE of RelBE toxin-antitoxin system
MFRIFTTEEFDKDFEKLDTSIQKMIDNEINQLEAELSTGVA